MAHGPLHQFLIQPIIQIEVAGIDLSFTNSSLFMFLSVFLILIFQLFGMKSRQVIPGRLQSMVEISYKFIADMVKDNAGQEGMKYFPFIFSLFMFVLFGNLLGLVPYGFTVTSHIVVTFTLALIVFLLVTFIGFAKHGWKFFKLFWPEGVPLAVAPILIPIEVVSYLIRPITLSVRLFANMLVGHILLKLFAGFIVSLGLAAIAADNFFGISFFGAISTLPLAFDVVFIGFEVFVAGIQAYIFTVLTCLYLHDSLHLH